MAGHLVNYASISLARPNGRSRNPFELRRAIGLVLGFAITISTFSCSLKTRLIACLNFCGAIPQLRRKKIDAVYPNRRAPPARAANQHDWPAYGEPAYGERGPPIASPHREARQRARTRQPPHRRQKEVLDSSGQSRLQLVFDLDSKNQRITIR